MVVEKTASAVETFELLFPGVSVAQVVVVVLAVATGYGVYKYIMTRRRNGITELSTIETREPPWKS